MAATPHSDSGAAARSDGPRAERAAVLAVLREHASDETLTQMGARYGIRAEQSLGVPMAAMKRIARDLGRDHTLAAELWATAMYEARIVAALVEEPDLVTLEQMDRWCADFDNWALCDTVCFSLFDRAPQAWSRLEPWAREDREFVRRASFALCGALHSTTRRPSTRSSSPASRWWSSTPRTSDRSSRSRYRCPCGPSGDATPPCRKPSVPPLRGWSRRTVDRHGVWDAPHCGTCPESSRPMSL